jgi:RNA polymerase sigma-70 factor, ECF subfamily
VATPRGIVWTARRSGAIRGPRFVVQLGVDTGPARAQLPSCESVATAAFWSPAMSDHASEIEDGSPNTLGDLLYADRSAAPIPEADWLRLIRSVAAADQQALRALYQRTHRLVFTLAMRISGSRESAEEVTLDVFRDVWLRSAQYDPKAGSVLGWIMNQTRSRAIDRLRFEQRKKRVAPHPDHGEREHVENPDHAIEVRRRRGLLHEALSALTPDERQAVETAFFYELTYAETAVRLNQPLGTVKTRIRSALSKLRQALETEGGRP